MQLDAPAKAGFIGVGLKYLREGDQQKALEFLEGTIDFELSLYNQFKESPKNPLLPLTVHSDMAKGSMEIYVKTIRDYREMYNVEVSNEGIQVPKGYSASKLAPRDASVNAPCKGVSRTSIKWNRVKNEAVACTYRSCCK